MLQTHNSHSISYSKFYTSSTNVNICTLTIIFYHFEFKLLYLFLRLVFVEHNAVVGNLLYDEIMLNILQICEYKLQ